MSSKVMINSLSERPQYTEPCIQLSSDFWMSKKRGSFTLVSLYSFTGVPHDQLDHMQELMVINMQTMLISESLPMVLCTYPGDQAGIPGAQGCSSSRAHQEHLHLCLSHTPYAHRTPHQTLHH